MFDFVLKSFSELELPEDGTTTKVARGDRSPVSQECEGPNSSHHTSGGSGSCNVDAMLSSNLQRSDITSALPEIGPRSKEGFISRKGTDLHLEEVKEVEEIDEVSFLLVCYAL